MSIIPINKPRAKQDVIESLIASAGVDRKKYPVVVVGVRGYYLDSMGKPGVNDRGIYDDAIFLCTPTMFGAFNGNTDPSKYRKGKGTGSGRGMASLKPGLWTVYTYSTHNGSKPHMALCQREGKVTVVRDGNPNYDDYGNFGINIHRGGKGTSSEGCQTIPPSQWKSFIGSAKAELNRYSQKIVPYLLVEEKDLQAVQMKAA